MRSDKKQCEEIRSLLLDRAVGRLGGSDVAAVEAHLEACSECRRYAGELGATVRLMKSVPSIAAAEGFDATLSAKLAAEGLGRKKRRAALLAVLVVALRRMRRFELGVAVYPLVLMAMAYMLWAMTVRKPGPFRPAHQYQVKEGRLMLWTHQPRQREVKLFARIDRMAAKEIRDLPNAPYQPGELEYFQPWPAELEPVRLDLAQVEWEPVVLRAPRTVRELEKLPEPAVSVPLMLRVAPPGGAALGRARFMTIRNSMPGVRVAVSRGLVWLCKNQERSGCWSAGEGRSRAPVAVGYSDVEVTAAALLAFMESGFTPGARGRLSRCLRAGLTWLVKQKGEGGMFVAAGPRRLQAQAMACVALSEALRLSEEVPVRMRFRPIIQEAVATLVEKQSSSGAWGDGDAELTALVLIAARAARTAGLAVDAEAQKAGLVWLESYRKGFEQRIYANRGLSSDTGKSVSYSTIGEVVASGGAVCASAQRAKEAARRLGGAPVVWESGDFFRWYAATLAAYRLGGQFWQQWRESLLRRLIPKQRGWLGSEEGGADRGSWEPHGLCRNCGKAYTTAMAVLSLTASCGHSPVYGGAK